MMLYQWQSEHKTAKKIGSMRVQIGQNVEKILMVKKLLLTNINLSFGTANSTFPN